MYMLVIMSQVTRNQWMYVYHRPVNELELKYQIVRWWNFFMINPSTVIDLWEGEPTAFRGNVYEGENVWRLRITTFVDPWIERGFRKDPDRKFVIKFGRRRLWITSESLDSHHIAQAIAEGV